jgi:hypothetical protein
MKKVDYNIEFAHIYTNENFCEEHLKAARIAQKKIDDFRLKNITYVTTILIDNYNSTDRILDIDKFIKKLEKIGVKSDFVVFEADLANYKDKCLELMNGKIKKQYHKYIETNEKCPCSFLVSIWHLARLGIFQMRLFVNKPQTKTPFIGKRTLTILPERYRSIEKKALDIIKSTKYLKEVEKMEYIFF